MVLKLLKMLQYLLVGVLMFSCTTAGDSGELKPGGTWSSSSGIIVMDVENAILADGWHRRATDYGTDESMRGSLGNGWIEFIGKGRSGTTVTEDDVTSIITFTFEIREAGDYHFRWRTKQQSNVEAKDLGNDSFVSLTSGKAVSGYQDFGQFHKAYVQSKDKWSWQTTFEPKHGDFYANDKVIRHYDVGTHTIRIAPRSAGHCIDRLVVFKSSVKFNEKTFNEMDESNRG